MPTPAPALSVAATPRSSRSALPQQRGDRFAARTGFDPRAQATPYCFSPRHIQAWREVNELPDRDLMRDGRWLVWPRPGAPRGRRTETPRAEAV